MPVWSRSVIEGFGGRSRDRWIVAKPVLQFAAIGLTAVVIVGLATSVASRRVGEREAVTDARTTTLVKAQGLVEPLVTDGLLTGEPVAVAAIATVVKRDVLDRSLVRVKIWTESGVIVYSDEARLQGSTYPLGDEEVSAIREGRIAADVSDLAKPENRYERSYPKLLEVYLPIRTPSGERLLFEAYFRYDAVSASGTRVWRSFAPISLGALVVLELLQRPLAGSLAIRLRQRQREREELLRRALDASDVERRRIAGDLHDGVVQDLAGVAFSLSAAARTSDPDPASADLLEGAATSIRAAITGLRSLLLDLYPPELADLGLAAALADLTTSAIAPGVSASLDTAGLNESIPRDVSTVLYRTAREALRNVAVHAQASVVTVRAGSDAERAWVVVSDDGVGFDPGTASVRAAPGHMGLRSMADLVHAANGQFSIDSRRGGGTTVRIEVPLR